jgi:hypothetical protein
MKTVSVSNAQGGFKQAPEGSMKRALVLLPVLLLTVAPAISSSPLCPRPSRKSVD